MPMDDTQDRSLLILGPQRWRWEPQPRQGDRFVVSSLSRPELRRADNTVLLELHDVHGWYEELVVGSGTVSSGDAAASTFVRALDPTAVGDLDDREALVPVLLLSTVGDDVVAHVSVRLSSASALFIRLPGILRRNPEHTPHALVRTIADALRVLAMYRTVLNNHQRQYTKFWPDREFEHKLTLARPADVWQLATRLWRRVRGGALPGYVFEYRDDLQCWDFENQLYDVETPGEGGYVSFITAADGTYVLKRKWFAVDAYDRKEQRWRGVVVGEPLQSYAERRFGVSLRHRGSFRRTRVDINVESLATGNVHSIMADRCVATSHHDAPDLCQVEIEYLHSRTLGDSGAARVHDELSQLATWAGAELHDAGIEWTAGHLSKATWLRSLGDPTESAMRT